MPLETDADILGMFDTNDHAQAAIYTPAGEAPMAVSVILDQAESVVGLGARPATPTGFTAMLPAAQIPDRPRKGELLSVGTRDFRIEAAQVDQAGRIWRLTLAAG